MRAGSRYDCESCGLRDVERDSFCDPLCKHPRDENGNAPPRPLRQRFEWFGGGPEQVLPLLARSVFALSMGLKRMRARRQVRRLVDAAGPPVPIARAEDGLIAIRGRVEVIDGVESPAEEEVAAYVWRDVKTRKVQAMTSVDVVSVIRGSGRFLVRDETGVALIDDDWLRLFGAGGDEPDPSQPGQLVIRDQQPVVAVGYCRRGGVAFPAGAVASFRGPPASIELVGGTRRPVCVFSEDPFGV